MITNGQLNCSIIICLFLLLQGKSVETIFQEMLAKQLPSLVTQVVSALKPPEPSRQSASSSGTSGSSSTSRTGSSSASTPQGGATPQFSEDEGDDDQLKTREQNAQ
jgi:hypothetical protein